MGRGRWSRSVTFDPRERWSAICRSVTRSHGGAACSRRLSPTLSRSDGAMRGPAAARIANSTARSSGAGRPPTRPRTCREGGDRQARVTRRGRRIGSCGARGARMIRGRGNACPARPEKPGRNAASPRAASRTCGAVWARIDCRRANRSRNAQTAGGGEGLEIGRRDGDVNVGPAGARFAERGPSTRQLDPQAVRRRRAESESLGRQSCTLLNTNGAADAGTRGGDLVECDDATCRCLSVSCVL